MRLYRSDLQDLIDEPNCQKETRRACADKATMLKVSVDVKAFHTHKEFEKKVFIEGADALFIQPCYLQPSLLITAAERTSAQFIFIRGHKKIYALTHPSTNPVN